MTLDEALQELGIERSASPEEARRAYLRGVKTRKPESNPEGFRRLREAYEMVAGLLQEQQTAQESAEIGEGEEDAPPELADLAARLSKLPSETHGEKRLAVLRQAVQDHPASSGVRWWLVQELSQPGLEQELLAALRAGDAAGFRGFLETRAARFPDSVDQDDLARLESSSDLNVLSATANVYLQRSRPREAVAVLNRVIDRLRDHEDPATRPLPSWLPRMILALEAAGLSQAARDLHNRLWRWLSGTGDANLLQSWGTVHWWNVAHELGLLNPAFPSELRRSAAQAVLSGNLGPAEERAKRFAKAEARQAKQASKMLLGLPMLHSLYYWPLQGLEAGVKKSSNTPRWILALFFLYLVANVLGRSCPNPSVPEKSGQQLRTQAAQAWAALEGSCNGPGRSLPRSSCEIMWRTVQAIESGNCSGALHTLEGLEDSLSGVGGDDLARVSDFERRVLSATTSACGTSQDPQELTR